MMEHTGSPWIVIQEMPRTRNRKMCVSHFPFRCLVFSVPVGREMGEKIGPQPAEKQNTSIFSYTKSS